MAEGDTPSVYSGFTESQTPDPGSAVVTGAGGGQSGNYNTLASSQTYSPAVGYTGGSGSGNQPGLSSGGVPGSSSGVPGSSSGQPGSSQASQVYQSTGYDTAAAQSLHQDFGGPGSPAAGAEAARSMASPDEVRAAFQALPPEAHEALKRDMPAFYAHLVSDPSGPLAAAYVGARYNVPRLLAASDSYGFPGFAGQKTLPVPVGGYPDRGVPGEGGYAPPGTPAMGALPVQRDPSLQNAPGDQTPKTPVGTAAGVQVAGPGGEGAPVVFATSAGDIAFPQKDGDVIDYMAREGNQAKVQALAAQMTKANPSLDPGTAMSQAAYRLARGPAGVREAPLTIPSETDARWAQPTTPAAARVADTAPLRTEETTPVTGVPGERAPEIAPTTRVPASAVPSASAGWPNVAAEGGPETRANLPVSPYPGATPGGTPTPPGYAADPYAGGYGADARANALTAAQRADQLGGPLPGGSYKPGEGYTAVTDVKPVVRLAPDQTASGAPTRPVTEADKAAYAHQMPQPSYAENIKPGQRDAPGTFGPVAKFQTRAASQGLYGGHIDGIAGPQTQAAIKKLNAVPRTSTFGPAAQGGLVKRELENAYNPDLNPLKAAQTPAPAKTSIVASAPQSATSGAGAAERAAAANPGTGIGQFFPGWDAAKENLAHTWETVKEQFGQGVPDKRDAAAVPVGGAAARSAGAAPLTAEGIVKNLQNVAPTGSAAKAAATPGVETLAPGMAKQAFDVANVPGGLNTPPAASEWRPAGPGGQKALSYTPAPGEAGAAGAARNEAGAMLAPSAKELSTDQLGQLAAPQLQAITDARARTANVPQGPDGVESRIAANKDAEAAAKRLATTPDADGATHDARWRDTYGNWHTEPAAGSGKTSWDETKGIKENLAAKERPYQVAGNYSASYDEWGREGVPTSSNDNSLAGAQVAQNLGGVFMRPSYPDMFENAPTYEPNFPRAGRDFATTPYGQTKNGAWYTSPEALPPAPYRLDQVNPRPEAGPSGQRRSWWRDAVT